MTKHFDCSPSNYHDLERIEELEKELRELKERIITVEATYTMDSKMELVYSEIGMQRFEREILNENLHKIVHDIYKYNLYREFKQRKVIPSLSGSYEVTEFTHKVYIMGAKRD